MHVGIGAFGPYVAMHHVIGGAKLFMAICFLHIL